MKDYMSFSQLMDWEVCSHYHHIKHVEGILADPGSEHTTFGTAVHEAAEALALEEYLARHAGQAYVPDYNEINERFLKTFEAELNRIVAEGAVLDHTLVDEMKVQGPDIIPEILDSLKAKFGQYDLMSSEDELLEPIEGQTKKFKGYVDLALVANGQTHIIDWKTCGWGWDNRKKTSIRKVYQLVLYRHFFAQKHGLNKEDVKCYFGLLKRTAKKNRVEIFEVPIGKKREANALALLKKSLVNIEKGIKVKDWLACNGKDMYGTCPFYQTKHCKKMR